MNMRRIGASVILILFAVETQYIASLLLDVSDPFPEIYSQTITPDTKSILEYEGIKLEIPAGATDNEVTIEILKLESAPGVSGTIKNVTTGAVSYRFLPDGIKFNKNIKISIPFNKALLESETALSNLYTYFYNEERGSWEPLPRVGIDRENEVVTSLTNHFTDMINGTLRMPESPEPVNFDINSIKNLEGANPSTGVMNLKGLTPDSMGSASFQIPLNLPPGRGTAYPNLSLSYNSESPNSWMGRGFDISVPSITTDTRFGLPEYDDTDTYILGGKEIILTAGEGSFPKSYSSRVEKSFSRIIRYSEGGVDYWEVTDKSGRRRTFGTEEGWIGPDRNNHAKAYTWYLTKETDANGNFASYIYDYDSVNKYTYLKEIRYSGNSSISSSDSGPYSVVFNTSESRPDRRIDSRGRFVSKLVRRLDGVDISFNGEVFRSYSFLYEQNEFGQTVLDSFSELDGSGDEFYRYGFSYNRLSPHDSVADAYDGFGTEVIEWGAVSGSTFPGLNQTRTFGIGASLYAGIKFEVYGPVSLFKWRWQTIAELGVRGGVNFSGTITKSTLLDINGDNLPDAVWKDGGVLRGYRNTGSSFNTVSNLSLPGIPGLMNRNSQKGFTLGLSAGLLGVSGSVTKQRNWISSLSTFNDINGDGLIDFVASDSSRYFMNNGSSFIPVDYSTNSLSENQSEEIDEDEYLRTYFSQEPVRKWKAYTGGRIEVSQSLNLLEGSNVSDDGINGVTFPGQGYPSTVISLGLGLTEGSGRDYYDVENGDEIYFHMDPDEDSRGDDINWDINISYTHINYFENIDNIPLIIPEETYNFSSLENLQFPEPELRSLYDWELIEDSSSSFTELIYTLKPDWEAIAAGFLPPLEVLPEQSLSYFDLDNIRLPHAGLNPLYDWEMVEDLNGFFIELIYTLKPDWKTLLNESSAAAIVELAIFVPSRIPSDIFLEIFSAASDTIVEEGIGITPGEKAALIDSFLYRPEFKDFVRENNGADDIVVSYLLGRTTISQRESLFYYTDFTGSSVVPEESGGIRSFRKAAPPLYTEPAISDSVDIPVPGVELATGEIVIDNIYTSFGSEIKETLRLIPDSGSFNLVSTTDLGTETVTGASVSSSSEKIDISFLRDGIEYDYSLTDPDSLLTSLPAEIYDGRVLDSVTSGSSFGYLPSYTSLSIDAYDTIYGSLAEEDDRTFFASVYTRYPEIPDITEYILTDSLSQADLDHLNLILPGDNLPADYETLPASDYDNAWKTASLPDRSFLEGIYSRYPSIPDIESYHLVSGMSSTDQIRLLLLFDSLGDDPDSILDNPLFLSGDRESFGIVALSETEYIQWFLGNTEVSGLFTAVVDGNSETFYVLTDNITEPEKVLFETACRKYLRDGILFPYYEYNAGRGEYTLLGGLGAEELDTVSSLFSGLGLSVFTSLNRSFTYFSNALLPVSYTGIDSVGNVDNDFPSGTAPVIHRNPGSVEIPYFDNFGRSSFFTAYIHNYNSEFDYSSENLVNYPEEIYNDDTLVGTDLALNTPEDRIPESFELFSGGAAGWFYGTWIGYYGDFDSTMLHSLPPGAAEGEVILPKYFTSMIRNTKIDGSSGPEVPEVGKDLLLVIDDNALTGDVSSYTESDFDENGEPVSKSYSFTSVISGNILHADRNGGDTYFNIPRGSSSITGSRIGLVSEGKSESKDLNGGVDAGVFSLSFSRNRGSSWQYRNLMDMNGDRYPDIVSYTSSEGGSNSFSVIAGNGQGFSDKVNYTSPVNNLSHSTNVSYGFGASPGSGNGAISQILSAAGVVKATTVDTPDKSSGVGIGFSGLNGTAGASYRTEGFLDVTGDGLPDHLKRDAGGEYFVAVNRGDNSFAPLVSYGSGINTTLYNTPGNAADLGTEALGLDFTNSGSLGTGGSISIPGVGIIQGAGISVGFNASSNRTLSRLIDINSDGLADQVVKKPNESFFRVRFNLGDSFSEAETAIFRPEWNTSFADTKGLLQSILGESASVFDSMDIPMVNAVPGVTTLPDAGANPFISIINPLGVDDAISYTGGISINLGASLTMVYGINLGVARFGFYLVPGINGSYAVSTTSLSMQDINGDGLPDHILKKTGSDTLLVKINSMGKVGLLNRITMPPGGSIDLEYEREGNTVAMPQNRYVLAKVVKNDGFEEDLSMSGEHSYTEKFDYNGGYYDRDERRFYGYHEVTITRGDGSVTTINYSNSDYYTKGLLLSTVTEDENGQVFQEQENSYSLRTLGSYTGGVVMFPYLSEETSRIYDPLDSDTVETDKLYFYDNYGNVIRMEDRGIYSDPGDNIILNISYSDNYDSSYLKSLPVTLTVRNPSGEIIRKREGSYDGRGNLDSLRSYNSEYDYSEYTFGYDSEYGNLIFVEDPLGYRKEYTYDSAFHRYVTEIETLNNSGGDSYTSNLGYDYRYGVETSQTDSNGNTLSKEYDSFGRLAAITSPYDTGTVKAVEYSYFTDSFPWKSMTKNKISFDPGSTETMDIWVIIDGLNRVTLTAKEGEVYNEAGNLYGWNKSGYVVYDRKGRSTEEGQTVFEETGTLPAVENTTLRPTLKRYDALDRILSITFPDNSVITKSYGVEGIRTIETVTDPLGNITETYKDIRGNIVRIEKRDPSETILTSADYDYNVLGELLKVSDAKGSYVTFGYDILGRRKTIHSPETGLTEFWYDKADHLIRKVDANLRNNGAGISYIYDILGRIEKIDYPFMEDTIYTYGAEGASYNRAGRIVRITDESGVTENYYGKLGETARVSKTVKRLTPLAEDKTADFDYTFDYFGRMGTIIYPDREVVSYTYNRGGEVEKVSSVHNGLNTTYIEEIGYDEYGQRAYIKYGNGVETNYSYDENRRWLKTVETSNTYTTLQDIDYTFDRTGNILSIINMAGKYSTTQDYEYDGLYQLTRGEGNFEDREFGYVGGTSVYTQNYSYDTTGNILTKTSSNLVTPSSGGVNTLNYNLEYTYYADKPKQAEIIGNLWYLYDSNGNIIEEQSGSHSVEGIAGSGTLRTEGEVSLLDRGIALTRNTEATDNIYKRTYQWDEENRLKTTIDPAHTVEYRYDSTGERTNKRSEKGGETLYFNSMWLASEESYDFRQSKNIYLGETRIATRLNMESDASTGYEALNTYYYHPDHLGSSNLVTTPDGEVFEHIEYTPYGETWIEKTDDYSNMLPYKFTAKELDSETGLYYYGARYLNPRKSRWISSDPAGVELINPTQKGFSVSGVNWYVYTSNNPVKYVDPTGLAEVESNRIHGDEFRDKSGTLRSPEFLDGRVAEEAGKSVGDNYVYGGKPDNDKGGLDCSGFVENLMEKISGVKVRERNADGQATDPNLTLPGNGDKGTLNFYDWKGNGKFDHVAVELGDGNIVNPKGGPENTSSNPGVIEKRGPFNTPPINRKINWRYLILE